MLWLLLCGLAFPHDILAEDWSRSQSALVDLGLGQPGQDPFRQLEELLPTPDEVRLASGAPGPRYWQNRADHRIDVSLDPETHRLTGSERITYTNASPHELPYLWVQLDQNRFREDSIARGSQSGPDLDGSIGLNWLQREAAFGDGFGEGMDITRVVDGSGRALPHTVVDTMMRIDLPRPVAPGAQYVLEIDWSHQVVPEEIWARSRVEVLDDGLPLYEVAQWFPRMAAYTDVNGWQHKAFAGRGEFTLEFGDYDVRITVPDTFVVAATGELQNPSAVLTPTQRKRLAQARVADEPVLVITAEEAAENERRTPEGTRTWVFSADDVRDFAWAASPSFLWDAWGVEIPGTRRTAMAMSYWPAEGDPLWRRYSTQAVAHTLEVYSSYSVPYPYPVAISVNGPVGGMEYPMICFNGPRPEEDQTYSRRTKYALIGVVIHEVGHNWFPMIINSDERQWTWMDEGLNTYLQFLAQSTWEDEFPSRRGEPADIAGYMSRAGAPVMTNSESLPEFGNNAYAKPATALNVLRETVLGREQMDHAFRTYSERWAFKRPEPADLFRTLEDVSGTDLDWFFRGWFFTTGKVDLGISRVKRYRLERDPESTKAFRREREDEVKPSLTMQRNDGVPRRTERFPALVDFYNTYDELDVTPDEQRAWERQLAELEPEQRDALERDWLLHSVRITRDGDLVMPVPLLLVFDDGSEQLVTLPAEVWKDGARAIDKVFVTERPIAHVELDPFRQLADTDPSDNRWPPVIEEALVRVDLPGARGGNPMRRARREQERDEGLAAVRTIAEALATGFASAGVDAPVDASATLLTLEPVTSARDPWGRPFVIELSATLLDDAPLALVRSAGEDGEPDSDDDLSWAIRADGTVQAR